MIIKKLFCLGVLLCLVTGTLLAQSPSWRWTNSDYNTAAAVNTRVCLDKAGNAYTVGFFTGSINFPDTVYDANGLNAMYIAKYNKDGKYLWSRLAARASDIGANAVAADGDGNVYIGGAFGSSGNNGRTMQLPDTIVTTMGWMDMFLIKYNTNGDYQWAKTFGGQYDDQIHDVNCDSKNNIVVSGEYGDSSIVIDNNQLNHNNIGKEIFVIKYDNVGKIVWAKQANGLGSDFTLNAALDYYDNIYIIASFYYKIFFDTIQVQSISQGLADADNVIAKYDSNGNVVWAKAIGGIGPTSGHDWGAVYADFLAVDSAGNAYIGGYFNLCTVIFGKNLYSPRVNKDSGEFWFAKYDASGQVLWAKWLEVGEYGYLYDMACDRSGNLYLAGDYGSDCAIDTIHPYIPRGNPVDYAFIAKYSTEDGRAQWVQTAGGGGSAGAVVLALAANNADEVVAVGQVYGGDYAAFGSHSCYNYGTTGNAFVAKLAPDKLGIAHLPGSADAIYIYPNPATDRLYITGSNAREYESYRLSNAVGQVVLSGKLPGIQSIQLPALPGGLYYLHLAGKGESITEKVFVAQ